MMDISTEMLGIKLMSPLLPASGPLTGTDERMIDIASRGVGAIVTKTIVPVAAEVGRPCIAGKGNMIFNSEAWSEYPAELWINEFFPNLREATDIPVIASVGYDDNDLELMIPKLEAFVAGYEYIPRYVGKDYSEVGRIVGVLRTLTQKPIWVKMNASVTDPVEFAGHCGENGADGIVAITSLGPNMVIDIGQRRPLIGIPEGYVWTSGPSIKPLALAYVHQVKKAFPSLSVIGCGGCSTADDVIEFLLAGADAVQMLSAALLNGRETYNRIVTSLPNQLKKYGFANVDDVKRTGLQSHVLSSKPSFPIFDYDVCNSCGICAKNCPYFALEMMQSGPNINKPKVEETKCFGCGLCESKCPVYAISNVL